MLPPARADAPVEKMDNEVKTHEKIPASLQNGPQHPFPQELPQLFEPVPPERRSTPPHDPIAAPIRYELLA